MNVHRACLKSVSRCVHKLHRLKRTMTTTYLRTTLLTLRPSLLKSHLPSSRLCCRLKLPLLMHCLYYLLKRHFLLLLSSLNESFENLPAAPTSDISSDIPSSASSPDQAETSLSCPLPANLSESVPVEPVLESPIATVSLLEQSLEKMIFPDKSDDNSLPASFSHCRDSLLFYLLLIDRLTTQSLWTNLQILMIPLMLLYSSYLLFGHLVKPLFFYFVSMNNRTYFRDKFHEFCEKLNIQHRTSTPYHPQTNDQKFSERPTLALGPADKDVLTSRLNILESIRDEVVISKEEQAQRWKKRYDTHVCSSELNVGDEVLLFDSATANDMSSKLKPKWFGPYPIVWKGTQH